MIQDSMTVDGLPNSLSGKHLVGFLVLLGEVTRVLGTRLVTYRPSLMKAIIAVVAHAQKVLESVKLSEAEQHIEETQNELDLEEEEDQMPQKVARNIRQLGIKRFTEQFRLPVEFDYRPYLPVAFESFISCRLETLDSENTQSPSALMELFHTWSTRADQITFLVDYNPTVLPKIYACLVAINVKPSVISRVFDIIEHILSTAPSLEEGTIDRLVKSHVTLLIEKLTTMIKEVSKSGIITSELSQRQIRILRAISEYVVDKRQASGLLSLILPLLRKPSRVMSESIKVDLLQTICPLLSLLPTEDQTAEIVSSTYEVASYLLQTLRNRQARSAATDVFVALAAKDNGMVKLVPLIVALNSFNPRRPQEPDFEQRMEAFAELNERAYAELIPSHWVPILNNMLHFVHDLEELSIRNNAAYTMRRFIEMVHTGDSVEMRGLFSKVLFVGLKRGLRSKHELVRAELMSIIAYSIKQLPALAVLQDMVPLLANGDEEVNFFNNIFHVQIHRRTRALRRLADHCEQGHLKSSTLYDIFVPVIGHYIGDSSLDHLLVNEAINTLGRIAQRLIWSRYYALVQKYLKAVKDKGSAEKLNLRALVTILDHFHFTMEEVVSANMGDDDDDDEAAAAEQAVNVKIADAVNTRLLPSLLQFMEKREETEDTLRLPIAIGIVKVALHLPQEKQRPQVTRLITILCQALRSKSSETRDMTRDILCKMAVAIGPSYLVDLVKELRVSLTRGPQLHVLAVTCHLLVHHLSQDEHRNVFENFDSIAASVAEISTEVIFGHSNKEMQSEENKTTFREMRGASSKGFDAMTILAKHITPVNISSLLAPLRSIMHETESIKVMQQVDETLKRISSGLNSNTSLDPKGLLSLCHTLISQNAKFLQEKPDTRRKNRGKKDFIVQTKRDLPQAAVHYAHNSYRFVAFGLDLFVVAFRRNRFDFQDPDLITRLEPMVSLIGNTLYSSATPVVTLGLKAVAAITRAPLQSIPKSLPVIIRQQVEIVRQSGSAESEVAQATLKSLASTLRDNPTAQLREGDLKLVLEIMEPDLEEPDRQAAVFALLRSIIQRKLVVPEIYDMLDKVANIVVTNQSSEVQETCRGILLQFLLDYPQGKGRLRKQMTFLASNLSYVFESGRMSVMTLVDAIFRKFEPSLLAEYADLFFMALVMVLANDESAKCREKAAALIKTLYQSMEAERRRETMERLHVWISQGEQVALTSVAVQVYGLIIDVALNDAVQRLDVILDDLNRSLEKAVEEMEKAAEQSNDAMDIEVDWQPAYHALVVLAKLLKIAPKGSLENVVTSISWHNVINLMLYPHTWIRVASTRLIGTFYAAHPSPGVDTSLLEAHPLSREEMIIIATNLSIQLRSEHLDLPFTLQIVKNLVFIAKSLHNNLVKNTENDGNSNDSSSEEASEDEEERTTEESKTARIARAPLPWLFSKLSYQIKSSHLKRRSSFVAPVSFINHVPISMTDLLAEQLGFGTNRHFTMVRCDGFIPGC
jgi:U3 small nucleolar RNA-associated protein 20